MSETVADPAAADASGAEGTPASGDGTAATTDRTASGADGSASGGVDFEAQARTWQSRYDQAQRRIAELEAASSASSSGGNGGGDGAGAGAPSDPMAQPITQADLIATLGRIDQMRGLATELQQEFPNAAKSVFANPLEYSSPEAFLAAARQSHEARTAELAEYRKQVDAEWMERLGPLAKQFETPAAGAESNAGEGTLTLESWLAMSLQEKERYYAENAEAVDKLIASVG